MFEVVTVQISQTLCVHRLDLAPFSASEAAPNFEAMMGRKGVH
jgi:hypothetical protein